jgi:hypothetical protein
LYLLRPPPPPPHCQSRGSYLHACTRMRVSVRSPTLACAACCPIDRPRAQPSLPTAVRGASRVLGVARVVDTPADRERGGGVAGLRRAHSRAHTQPARDGVELGEQLQVLEVLHLTPELGIHELIVELVQV